jgi:hypothetical protein
MHAGIKSDLVNRLMNHRHNIAVCVGMCEKSLNICRCRPSLIPLTKNLLSGHVMQDNTIRQFVIIGTLFGKEGYSFLSGMLPETFLIGQHDSNQREFRFGKFHAESPPMQDVLLV